MMHRVKKDQDENAGKWIGIGGHLEENESPDECIRRECREEAGMELTDLQLRGIIHIHVDQIEAQVMLSEIVEPAVNLDFQRAVIVGGALFDACALGILCCKCSCARTKEQKDQDKQHFFCKFFHVSSFR